MESYHWYGNIPAGIEQIIKWRYKLTHKIHLFISTTISVGEKVKVRTSFGWCFSRVIGWVCSPLYLHFSLFEGIAWLIHLCVTVLPTAVYICFGEWCNGELHWVVRKTRSLYFHQRTHVVVSYYQTWHSMFPLDTETQQRQTRTDKELKQKENWQ